MGGGFGDWIIGVYLRFSTDGPVTMARLGASTQAANAQLLKQQGLIDANTAAMLRYQRQIEMVRMQQLRMGTMMAGGVALGGIAASVYALKQAADLQTAMVTIRAATGANAEHMERLTQVAYQMSNITAQSVVNSAQVLAVMASAGINDPRKLEQIAIPAAKFADVQYLRSRGQVDFQTAATWAIQLAHLYNAYTPQAITPILNRITQLSYMMPDSLQRYVTQAAYYVPYFRRAQVPDYQTEVLGAFMDRMGMGRNKGGTSLADFLKATMNSVSMTGILESAKTTALTQLGLINPDGTPRFFSTNAQGKSTYDLFGALEQINRSIDAQTHGLKGDALTKRRAEMLNDIVNALGIQGGRFGMLGTPAGIGQLLMMTQQLGRMPNMDQMQGMYMNTAGGQFLRAVTNFKSVMTELGTPWLDDLTVFFRGLGNNLHDIQAWLHGHKSIDHDIGAAVATMTTLFSARFVIGIAVLSKQFLGLAGSMNVLAGDIDLVTRRILADDVLLSGGALRPGMPPVLPGGGAAPVEEGASLAGKFEIGGMIAWALSTFDNIFLAGLGKSIIGQGAKWIDAFGIRFGVPLLSWVSRLGGVVRPLAPIADFVESSVGRLGLTLLKVVGPLGDIATLFSLIGQIPTLPGMPGWNQEIQDLREGHQQAYMRDLAARIHKYGAQRALARYDRAASHIGTINFNLPKGTPQAQARAAFQHFLQLTGHITTSAYVPNALTVGGAAFGTP